MLKTGVLLRHGGESVFVKMEFDAMPEDALAHKHVWNLKGASAKAPCPECCNCMGRCPRFELDPDGYVHVLSPDYGRWAPRTRARIFEMPDDIEAKATHGTRAELKEAERAYGLKWDPLGL